MELFEAINTRRSSHDYKPGMKISREQWEELFGYTLQSPTSWNLQPWKFLVIEDDEKREAIRKMAWDQDIITNSSAVIVVLGDTDPHRNKVEIFQQWRDQGIINEEIHEAWLNAVGAVYPTDYEQHEFAIRNTSFGAMTLMLAAHGMGLNTTPMIGFDKKALSEYIGVPEGWILSFIITIGYPDKGEPFERQPRYGMDQVVSFDEL